LINNDTDLRVLKTHRAIEDAFFKLLDQEPYENITVLQIVDEALIGQTTFYRHYQDKIDLASQLIQDSLDTLGDFLIQQLDTGRLVDIVLPPQGKYVQLLDHVRLLRTINTPDLSFETCAVNHIAKVIHYELSQRKLNLNYSEEISGHLAALSYSFFMSLVDQPDGYNTDDLRAQVHEFSEALTVLIATPPPQKNKDSVRHPNTP
jgi:AcrR family transcriptional regulator